MLARAGFAGLRAVEPRQVIVAVVNAHRNVLQCRMAYHFGLTRSQGTNTTNRQCSLASHAPLVGVARQVYLVKSWSARPASSSTSWGGILYSGATRQRLTLRGSQSQSCCPEPARQH